MIRPEPLVLRARPARSTATRRPPFALPQLRTGQLAEAVSYRVLPGGLARKEQSGHHVQSGVTLVK